MSDRKRAARQLPTRAIVPRVRGELRRVRLRVPITTRIVLSPPRHAQMRSECAPTSADQPTSAVDSDDANEGDPTCAR